MNDLPCNCCHSKAEHHVFSRYDDIANRFYSWCMYSEYGACPCDAYTPMTNLEYLEFKNDAKHL
jgi:hypothetical protein